MFNDIHHLFKFLHFTKLIKGLNCDALLPKNQAMGYGCLEFWRSFYMAIGFVTRLCRLLVSDSVWYLPPIHGKTGSSMEGYLVVPMRSLLRRQRTTSKIYSEAWMCVFRGGSCTLGTVKCSKICPAS